LISTTGAIVDGGNTHVEVEAAGRLVISAATGVGHGDALEINAGSIDAVALTSGDISFVETDSVTIYRAAPVAGFAVEIAAGEGIALASSAVIATTSTAVLLSAETGAITMADGASIVTDSGGIVLSAGTDVALGVLTSATGTIDITAGAGASASGAITDNTADESPNVVATAAVSLTAETGIGASGDADIDTTITTLHAENRTAGDVVIEETDTLSIPNGTVVITGGDGDVSIHVPVGAFTQEGTIIISDNKGTAKGPEVLHALAFHLGKGS